MRTLATKNFDIARFTVTAMLAAAVVIAGAASGPETAQGAVVASSTPDPAAVRVLFREDFEGFGGTPRSIASVPAYRAAPAWVAACNGNVVRWSAPASGLSATSCSEKSTTENAQAFDRIRQLAWALGRGATGDPASNHALAGYTDGSNPGADGLVLGTAEPLTLPSVPVARFLSVRVRSAAVNCDRSGPRYRFRLTDSAGNPHDTGGPLDACAAGDTLAGAPAAPGGTAYDGTIVVGTVQTGAVLVPGGTVDLEVRNANGSGSGNDGAIDDLELLDDTPEVRADFSPASVTPGQPSRLTLTVTNTAEGGAKTGFSVLDALPVGVHLDQDPGFVTTCADGELTALGAGTTSLRVQGSLPAGVPRCTFSVRVIAADGGTYVNRPGTNLRHAVGLAPSGEATLRVRPVLALRTTVAETRDVAGDQLVWSFALTNTGRVPVPTVWIIDDTAGAVVCPTGPVLPGRTITCHAHAPYVVTAQDARRGEVRRTSTARGPGVWSEPVRSVTRLH